MKKFRLPKMNEETKEFAIECGKAFLEGAVEGFIVTTTVLLAASAIGAALNKSNEDEE